MNLLSIVLLVLIAVWLIAALVWMHKKGTSCGQAECSNSCSSCIHKCSQYEEGKKRGDRKH